MGNFEKLSVLVIVVIIVMILVVALYTWSEKPEDATLADADSDTNRVVHNEYPQPDRPVVPLSVPSVPVNGTEPIEIPISIPEPGPISEIVEPLPTPVEPGANEPWVYTMKRGELVSVVCNRELGGYYKFLPQLKALNPGLDFDRVATGQQLTMPPKGFADTPTVGPGPVIAGGGDTTAAQPGTEYVVRKNESLKDIAKRVYGDWKVWVKIYATNHTSIRDPNYVSAGTRLQLPPR